MNLPYGLLADQWLWGAHALYAVALALAFRFAPWWKLRDNENLHVFLGACVGLMFIWAIKAGASPGLEYHFLGATLLTLMFGWAFAVIGMSVVLLGTVINGMSDWQTYSLNVLVMGVLPVMISHSVYRLADRWLPNHFIVYIFVCAFFTGALAMLATILAGSGVLAAGGVYTMDKLGYEYLPFAPLMMFPEAFITGTLMTVLVGLKPQWVSTFDDDRYLNGK